MEMRVCVYRDDTIYWGRCLMHSCFVSSSQTQANNKLYDVRMAFASVPHSLSVPCIYHSFFPFKLFFFGWKGVGKGVLTPSSLLEHPAFYRDWEKAPQVLPGMLTSLLPL